MLPLFLAKRFFSSRSSRSENGSGASGASSPAIRIAIAGMAIGLAVMIVSVCIVRGFQGQISHKLVGFVSHIEVSDPQSAVSPELNPVVADSQIVQAIRQTPGVEHVQCVSQKIGILKTTEHFSAISLRGVGKDYDLSFLKENIVSGTVPPFGTEAAANAIVLSRIVAEQLGLKVGDKVYSYYFSNTIKQRRLTVAALYDTHLAQFDKMVVWADRSTVNRLNSWTDDQCSTIDVRLRSFDCLPSAQHLLVQKIGGRTDRCGHVYSVTSIRENPLTKGKLSWLDLLDFNVMVILIIMACVAGFAMISGLLILILERTTTIGLLKAQGMTNRRIRHTFMLYAAFIVLRGLFWGNVAGLGLVAIQYYFRIISLDPTAYYLDTVPVVFDWLWIVIVNIGTFIVTMLALVLPGFMVAKVQPAEAIRFD